MGPTSGVGGVKRHLVRCADVPPDAILRDPTVAVPSTIVLRDVALWVHLLAVIVWVGSLCGWTLVLFTWTTPGAARSSGPRLHTIGHRIYAMGWEALGFLVISGLFNLLGPLQSGALFEAAYLRPLLWKIGLVTGMAVIQLWQHIWLLPRLTATRGDTEAWSKTRRSLLIASGLVLAFGATVVWLGVQLHHG